MKKSINIIMMLISNAQLILRLNYEFTDFFSLRFTDRSDFSAFACFKATIEYIRCQYQVKALYPMKVEKTRRFTVTISVK